MVWAIIFWAINLWAILVLLIEHAQGPLLIKTLLWVLLLIYLSLYAGVWFLITTYIQCRLVCSPGKILALWALGATLYFIFIEEGLLWIFDYWEGYSFAYPLISLANWPLTIRLVPLLGKHTVLLLLVIANSVTGYYLVTRALKKSLVLLLSVLAPFIFGYSISVSQEMPPSWLSQMGCVRRPLATTSYIWDTAHVIKQELVKLLTSNLQINYVFMPESTIRWPLNQYPELLAYWQEYGLLKNRQLVIGAHRLDDTRLYNSLYQVWQGKIINYYDKQHGMFFVERLPRWFFLERFKNLFLAQHVPFVQATKQSTIISLNKDLQLVPLICSELFFGKRCLVYSRLPLLVICNDTWFSCGYQQELMFLLARFRAVEWRRSILYISYTKAALINSRGTVYPIIANS